MAKTHAPKLPECGQWPDKLVPALLAAGLIASLAGFLAAFLTVPPVNGASVDGAALIGGQMVTSKLLISQKIFFFHMPVAIVSFAALCFAAYYSARYLMARSERFDTCARTAMEIALLFVALTMVTGEMWTRFEWGVWWTWDPRLTTYLVLMLIVIAYMVMRGMVDEPERRAAFSAVVSIVAFVDVPICLLVTRMIPSSLHPVVLREGGMTGEMGLCLGLCMLGFCCLGFALYRLRFGQLRLEQRVAAAREQLEEE
ncbi:MAG: cytochrome c biogenesis protein [Coriobacteriales bacterium]